MPRPKKAAKKVPVKNTRRVHEPIPVDDVADESLRFACLDRAVTLFGNENIIEGARKIYDFVKGNDYKPTPMEEYQFGDKEVIRLNTLTAPSVDRMLKAEDTAQPDLHHRSKFDAHTL